MLIIEDIIKDYMQTHSRLTVVGLGTFLTKEGSDQLLFTEFVMEDDGVLFETLVKSGVCDVEATSMIENFVDAIQKRFDSGESYYIEGVGTLRKTPIGIRFKHQQQPPEPTATVVTAEEEEIAEEIAAEVAADETPIEQTPKYKMPYDEPTKRRIDFLMLSAIVLVLFAVSLFAYSLVLKWQMGELLLPEVLDNIMYEIFGSL